MLIYSSETAHRLLRESRDQYHIAKRRIAELEKQNEKLRGELDDAKALLEVAKDRLIGKKVKSITITETIKTPTHTTTEPSMVYRSVSIQER